MNFLWFGLLRTGQLMRARTHHEWTLHETTARYLPLHHLTATAPEPFTPVSPETALAALSGMVGTNPT